jgi:hypothetical protein
MVQQERKYKTIELGIGKLTLCYTKRMALTSSNHGGEDRFNTSTDYTSMLTFVPSEPSKFHMLVASSLQGELSPGTLSPWSIISVKRVLHLNSRVFGVVYSGNLAELRRMLKDGEASLRDHDQLGCSLLFVSNFDFTKT